MSPLVLITRPLEQAKNFAAEIKSIGAVPIIQPVLIIESYPVDLSLISKPDAIVLTSAQGIDGKIFPNDWCDVPVFCVGHKTESFVRQSGATLCYSTDTDSDALLTLIREKLPAGKRIVYLRGEHITLDLEKALAKYQVENVVTYCAREVADFDADVIDIFPQIAVVTLFSRRSAEILVNLLKKNNLVSVARTIKLLCLSSAVLESVQDIDWESCHVADRPDQAAMVEKLKDLIRDLKRVLE
jgi:uroporphyrinogen-III synthase